MKFRKRQKVLINTPLGLFPFECSFPSVVPWERYLASFYRVLIFHTGRQHPGPHTVAMKRARDDVCEELSAAPSTQQKLNNISLTDQLVHGDRKGATRH